MGLLFQGIRILLVSIGQEIASIPDYLRNPKLWLANFYLRSRYFLRNPFRIQSSYARQTGRGEPHQYGETPIPVVNEIIRLTKVTEDDHFLDCGSGTGKVCFRVRLLTGAETTGMEEVPLFVSGAKMVAESLKIDRLSFEKVDFCQLEDFSSYTVVFLYGIFLSDEDIVQLLSRLAKTLPASARLITVSFAAADYLPGAFETEECRELAFPWGKTDVCVQRVLTEKM